MHLYFMARGYKLALEKYLNDLMAQKWLNAAHNGQSYYRGLDVREWKFIEVAFPREILKEVMATVQPYGNPGGMWPYVKLLRKMLGAKPLPSVFVKNSNVYRGSLHVVPIGIKEDKLNKFGKELI